MIVTIYKNCKLNHKYKDIFYNKVYLEEYLGTLTNRIVINDGEVFSRNNDSLYIDGINISDFKQYNYLKIEDSIGTFYAFINNIEWINDVYFIHYEEDILSNYFENVHIRNSLLTGNKSLKLYKGQAQKDIKYFKLPIDTESNDFPIVTGYNIEDNNDDPEIVLLVKIQFYKLGTAGEFKNRQPSCGLLGFKFNNVDNNSFKAFNSLTDNLTFVIENFINGANTIYRTVDNENIYYEIDKIYALPKDFINLNKLSTYKINIINGTNWDLYINYFDNSGNTTEEKLKISEYEKTIDYDYANFSVGIYTNQLTIANNGTDINIKVNVLIKGYGIQIIMYVNNRVIDLTEDFILDIPFTQLNASALQLQRLQLDLQENSLKNKIDNSNQEIIKNKANLIIGATSGVLGAGIGAYAENPFATINGVGNALSEIANRGAAIEENKNDVKYSAERINLINKAMYCSTQLIKNNFSYINGIYGLVLCKLNIDNETQIEQGIKLSGYSVRELVNDVIQNLDTEHLTDHYEVFKFDEVNLYGVIAQDYLRVIERVLLNGVRVWCQNDIGELI